MSLCPFHVTVHNIKSHVTVHNLKSHVTVHNIKSHVTVHNIKSHVCDCSQHTKSGKQNIHNIFFNI